MVEHVIGNDGVASPILASGTTPKTEEWCAIIYNYRTNNYTDFVSLLKKIEVFHLEMNEIDDMLSSC